MPEPSLIPDCANCAALCCVLLAFDASPAFADDKPACVACRHLADDHRCGIHDDLEGQGFAGCSFYTCHGAGQRITSEVFQGRSWRDDPNLLPAMADAFRTLRRLHEAAWMLDQAGALPLTPTQDLQRRSLRAALDLDRVWDEQSLGRSERDGNLRAIRPFLTSLRDLSGLTLPRR